MLLSTRLIAIFILGPLALVLACKGGTRDPGGGGTDTGGGGSAAFPNVLDTPGRAAYTFTHDGRERSFVVYVPEAGAPPRPLVVVLHGGGGSAKQMFEQHPLEAMAEERGIVIIAAEGVPQPGDPKSNEWNAQFVLPSLDSGVDDIGYLETVILGVTDALEIDSRRRYVTGFSGGASMAVRFGAEKSEHLAAIGTFAGKVGLSEAGGPFVFSSAPSSPLSVQMVYGTLDPNLEGELKGDVQATSGQAGISWWAESLGCPSEPTSATDPPVTYETYEGCNGDAVVRMLTVEGLKHSWPDLDGEFPLDGTRLMLDFFEDKVRP